LKKKHPEHVNLERWLVSYADFITLLFAFFVVMYSIANQDKQKIKQITESIEKSFFGASGKLDMGTGKSVNVMSNPSSTRGRVLDLPMGHTNASPESMPELEEIAKRIEESIAYQFQTTDFKDTFEMTYDDRGLVIRMSANKIYKKGQEGIEIKYLPLIDRMAEIILKTQRLIRIEGHTDNTPLGEGGKFPTNWELSSARAAWITRYLIAKFNFPARRLSAAGYAEGRPIVENTTEENKSKNRRIELVVTNIKDNAPIEQ
jgi:chemotaxis protein MotB